ncbi:MAG TPA: hypothetical protein VFC00_30980 [Micromonosporaceae bacterium]|nr:hypothetical protein [Micromonosporaceae bacterium]
MATFLSPERAAQLREQLRQLHRARQRAWVEIRTYPIITTKGRPS